MLHNILLKAGLYTEIAKQGKFINVVLAAGEITARIRMDDDSVFETLLVSGMAFPVPQGFKSVALSSDITQQTKVWLGNLPLSYSSIDSRQLGAEFLKSNSTAIEFGTPREIAPYHTGRQKMTIRAQSEFKIGDEFVSDSTAIVIPANTNFEITSQGAVFGFTGNAADTITSLSNMQMPLTQVDFTAVAGGNYYFQRPLKGGSLISVNNFGINQLKQDMTLTTISTLNQHIFIAQDGVGSLYFAAKTNTIKKATYNVGTGDYTLSDWVNWTSTDGSLAITAVTQDGLNLAYSDSWGHLYVGTQAVKNVRTNPIFTNNGETLGFLTYTDTGRIVALSATQCMYSDDAGVTWIQYALPQTYHSGGGYSQGYCHDRVTNKIYYSGNNYKLMCSIDNGASFQEIVQETDYITSIYAEADVIVYTTNHQFATSTDGATFTRSTLTGTKYFMSCMIGNDNNLYLSDLNLTRGTTRYSNQGSPLLRGGLNVSILEEYS